MSMPPQPPQGPYGPQPPQQNNPYAQPNSPYGQQPPHQSPGQQPSYGYPQQQLPPQGAPQGPWGQPGMPAWPGAQPPKKKRTGLIIGIAAAALVAVGALAYTVSQVAGAGKSVAGGFPDATYQLTVPKKLLDEEYTLAADTSSTDGKAVEEVRDLSVRDVKAVVTQYTSAKGGVLVISGMWGRIKMPELTRDKILEGAAGEKGMTVVVPAREFTPDGYDITVSCQVVTSKDAGRTSTIPMCAWGDDNTAAFVGLVTAEIAAQDPKDVDLEQAAADTAQVRAESRKPIG
ncbi:hypothetical protein [Streptomyces sp. NBC_00316]|uniref:hypothetical protein n=1 Tax=Streptomyces sp. NBC_00316 TaxID=2975710 RepID=UPI002E2DB197|nr:hypothetical protein [Streptomyces sp. NBC_00316]